MSEKENKKELSEQDLGVVTGGAEQGYPKSKTTLLDKKSQELYGKNFDELTDEEKRKVKENFFGQVLKYGNPHIMHSDYACPHMDPRET